MTIGDIRTGTIDDGPYLARRWSGGDGLFSDEHPYACTLQESYLPKVRARWIGGGPWYDLSMYTFCPGIPQYSDDFWRICVNKCNSKVWGKLTQSQFNAGVFAAEYREAYHMICDMVHGLAKGIRLMKKRRFSEAIYTITGSGKRTPLSIVAANNYMVWHFGIIPTLSDIKGFVDYMQKDHSVVKRIRASSSESRTTSFTANTVTWKHTTKYAASIRGNVVVTELSEADRLGLTDPVSVAWEATRLSWLIDWVLPIGNYLSAVNAARKTSGDQFWLTTMQFEELSNPTNGQVYEILPFVLSAYNKLYTRCHRESYLGLPWTFPVIENPLGDNLNHWVTSAAFLRQSVGKR